MVNTHTSSSGALGRVGTIAVLMMHHPDPTVDQSGPPLA